MKNKNLQKLILVLLVSVLYFSSSAGCSSVSKGNFIKASRTAITDPKDFLNIIFNLPSNWTLPVNWVETNLPLYSDSLHYNAIQIYNDNSPRFGNFESSLSASQIENVKGIMSAVESSGLKGFYARTNITWLAEAQRLEYEISENGNKAVNNGFSYQDVLNGTYTTDGSRTVLNPKTGTNRAGWLCKNIYENIQHSDFVNSKDRGNWFVKPVMRIDKSRFSADDTTAVVRIDIRNYKGDLIKSVNIRVRNFGDSDFNYDGSYISNYNFQKDPGNSLEISGNDNIATGLNYENKNNFDDSKVDFRVYWYGLVDVWFDKMIVDDELGNNLFNGIYDDEIKGEVSNFASEPSNYTFYCDEIVYSQIPCVEYIRNKMKSYEPNSNISFVMSNIQNVNTLRNDTVAYGPALSRIKPKVFFADPYLIPWEIPDNVNFPGAEQVPDNNYNTIMQNVFSSFVEQVDLARRNVGIYSPDSTKFFMIPQLFGSMLKNSSGNFFKYGSREPTNEEIEVQAMLSIAYDAQGLGWFIYQSSAWKDTVSNDSGFVYGLLNPDGTKRTANIFKQDKWNYVKKMNKKILNWKPVLDKIIWVNAFSININGANHNFISDLKSYYSSSIPLFSSPDVNEDDVKYWEMGFFSPDFSNPDVDPNYKTKYFIIVNKRCVPNINNDGDLRQLKINFNPSQLSGFNNWKITDLDSNKEVAVFDKDSNRYIDMGIYQPGEGRLYKIEPVM